jgi:hypothetical protein
VPAVRLPFSFDPTRLQEDLSLVPEAAFRPHRWQVPGWKVVFMGTSLTATSPCTPYVEAIVRPAFQCEVSYVRFSVLGPGTVVRPHIDKNGTYRIHIPVWQPEGADLVVAGQAAAMKEGESWWVDADREVHEVVNRSSRDRVHLHLDCVSNEWLRAIVAAASRLRRDGQ